ncbi:MAG: outer membrane lipoprotein-sorting protein, partial [Bacteroidota bacterium]
MRTTLITLIMIAGPWAWAQSPEQRGLEIAQKADEVDQGFESSSVSLTMVMRNKNGQETTRYLENKILEQA